jgi:hypothetical protein
VPRWSDDRALRIWSIGLAVLLVVTATACMSHSDAHAHDLPHPLLCLDAPSAMAEGRAPLRQFAVSTPFQSFLKYSALIALSPGIPLLSIVEQGAQDHPLRWALYHLFTPTLRARLPVLRL